MSCPFYARLLKQSELSIEKIAEFVGLDIEVVKALMKNRGRELVRNQKFIRTSVGTVINLKVYNCPF